ncbi:hypothetical protein [Phocaeicola sp.]|jgi:hypothetical protein|uniref:hypothetical protein n=1 Tax=Phocaeicola sp. TaxID=2773926 RepID=UPI003A2C2D6E
MKFSLYNVLSSLLHGFVLLYVVFHMFSIEINDKAILFYTAIAYFLGFFINTLSSWIEPLYFWCWGGKPSNKLLDGNSRLTGIKLYQADVIKNHLKSDVGNGGQQQSNDCLFSIAKRKAGETNRISDLNGMYAFSRGLLTLSFVLSALLISKFYFCWWSYVICIITIVILNIRSRQFAYYYSREVYTTYLTVKETQPKIKTMQ